MIDWELPFDHAYIIRWSRVGTMPFCLLPFILPRCISRNSGCQRWWIGLWALMSTLIWKILKTVQTKDVNFSTSFHRLVSMGNAQTEEKICPEKAAVLVGAVDEVWKIKNCAWKRRKTKGEKASVERSRVWTKRWKFSRRNNLSLGNSKFTPPERCQKAHVFPFYFECLNLLGSLRNFGKDVLAVLGRNVFVWIVPDESIDNTLMSWLITIGIFELPALRVHFPRTDQIKTTKTWMGHVQRSN